MRTPPDLITRNPLVEVQKQGQSIWYDNISRGLITSGELRSMVETDGLMGMTSNPAIFEKAVTGSDDYDEAIRELVTRGAPAAGSIAAGAIYEALAVQDIRMACDVLAPVYARTAGRDGFVSLEVSPYLAGETEPTILEARRLHKEVSRPNLMIKVPGTPEGIPAVEALVADGISVNVTLLFGLEAYEAAALAYMSGLEKAAAKGLDPAGIASVASFFVSRIDSLVDERLKRLMGDAGDPARRERLAALCGKAAIANARTAYALYGELVSGARWRALAARGARTQRVLWASTSTKNPDYPKTLYVDELIGPDTVNTIPAETFAEFRARGRVRPSLTENWDAALAAARETLAALEREAGISIREVAETLLADGIAKFADPFDHLMAAIEKKREAALGTRFAAQSAALPADAELGEASRAASESWRKGGKIRRLWKSDAALWSGADEARWTGWLGLAAQGTAELAPLAELAARAREGGFRHAVVLGMGGSSLAPDVIRETLGSAAGCPELLVCDSTVPAQVAAVAARLDMARTLFIVSSKSGSTVEPNVMLSFFLARAAEALGAANAASHFVAVTDPGSALERVAKEKGFLRVLPGLPSVGGRFSALSNFGLLPAAVSGVDAADFVARAALMADACGPTVPPEANPGVALGLLLGTAARAGRDKLTLVSSPGLRALGAWLEQLIAESTGKQGHGIVPVDGETLAAPDAYGADRVFVYTSLATDTHESAREVEIRLTAIERAGHPVVRIQVQDARDLGAEFFRWEIATSVAGSVMGLNPFDQPDVESAKVAARKLMETIAARGSLPPESPLFATPEAACFADAELGAALGRGTPDLAGAIRAHIARLRPGDYFAVQAYVEMSPANDAPLQELRHAVRDARRVATTLGYGPRFLHSTGQLHKGGPATGLYLQVTSDDAADLPIPGERASFGMLKSAQARGDFEVLAARGRRVLRVHLGRDVPRGLATLARAVKEATR